VDEIRRMLVVDLKSLVRRLFKRAEARG